MENSTLKILLIENDPEFAGRVKAMLAEDKPASYAVVHRTDFEPALDSLGQGEYDLALIELALPDGAGLANVERAQAASVRVPVIVLGAIEDDAVALAAVHSGAQDYLVKNQLNPQLLGRAIRYAVERQRADAALLEAEEKYRGIFEHIVEGIFQTSPDGRYLSANGALARIYGYNNVEDLMSGIKDIGRKLYVDPERRGEFIKLMQEHDTVTDFESQIYRKDGSVIWIAENVRAIRDATGKLLYYEGTVEDITQRRNAEENLRQSEALYHSLVETLPQNIFRKDAEGRFTFVNQRFCNTIGRSAADILGKTDFDLFPKELAEKYHRDDQKVMERKKGIEATEKHQPPGSEMIYVQVVKTPLLDSTGQVFGLQGIFWDISERKRAEEQIRIKTHELARSQEDLRKKNEQMQDDLKMAREIQQTLLPQQYPTFPKGSDPHDSYFRFSHLYLPTGAVGGDYFNVIALSDTEAGIFICDVMGHGVRSALVAAMVRALVEELKPFADDPGKLLTYLNRDLCAILKHTGSPTLTTACYLIADVTTGMLRYANAGHPKPFLVHRDDRGVELLSCGSGRKNPALGLFDDAKYTTTESPYSPHDLVMLFTDGLYEVEGADQQLYTNELLMEAVQKRHLLPAGELFDAVLAEIKRFALGQDFADDVCLLGMELPTKQYKLF